MLLGVGGIRIDILRGYWGTCLADVPEAIDLLFNATFLGFLSRLIGGTHFSDRNLAVDTAVLFRSELHARASPLAFLLFATVPAGLGAAL